MCTLITQRGLHLFILNQTQVFYPLRHIRHIPAVATLVKVPNLTYIRILTCKISGLSLFLANKTSDHAAWCILLWWGRFLVFLPLCLSFSLSLSLSGVTCSLTSGRLSLNSTNVTFNEAVGWNYRSVTHIHTHLHRKHSRQTQRLKTVSLFSQSLLWLLSAPLLRTQSDIVKRPGRHRATFKLWPPVSSVFVLLRFIS